MSMNEVTKKVNELANHWENFKQVNDRKINEVKNYGGADCTTDASLNNLNKLIDECQNRIDNIELSVKRPSLNVETKSFTNLEHKSYFKEYIKKGVENNLSNFEQKSLSVLSDNDGGYFVPNDIKHNIYSDLDTLVAMRKLANVQEISTDSLEIIEDFQSADAGWTSENNLITETSAPKLFKKIIPVHEIYAQPKATQKLIDDSAVDIEAWLSDKISRSFSELEDYAFIKGDGQNKPRGILSYADGKEHGKIEQISSANNLNASILMKLFYSLKENYAAKASFLMNRQTTFAIRSLKNESGQYLWSPSLAANQPETLLGAPVYYSESMPLPTNGALAIAFADFSSAYQIVDRSNIKLMRDPFTEKPFVKFYATKRVGGDVVNFNAIKLLKI